MVTVESLSTHPELVAEVVDLAWTEWGAELPEVEHARWLRLAKRDCQLNAPFSAGFLAVEGHRAVGTVQLHEFDIDEMRDRSPWICGMVVRPEYRGMQIGRRLLEAVMAFACRYGIEQLWVFTQGAAKFYEACGWERFGETEHTGEPGVVLTHSLGSLRLDRG